MIESWKHIGSKQIQNYSPKHSNSKYLQTRQKSKPAPGLEFSKANQKSRPSIDRPIKNFKGGFIKDLIKEKQTS